MHHTVRVWLLVLVCLVTCGCSGVRVSRADPSLTPIGQPSLDLHTLPDSTDMTATETAEAFYSWYATATRRMLLAGQPLDPDLIGQSGYLSPQLAQRIVDDREAMSAGPGGADPILCAQDIPSHFHAVLVAENDGKAVVDLTSDLIGHHLSLDMSREGDIWVIDDIACCSAIEDTFRAQSTTGQQSVRCATRDGWHAYACPDFDFDVCIPGDWVYQEHAAGHGEPPIGPACVRVVTLLMPQTWADELARRQGPPSPDAPAIAPFTIEVVHGNRQKLDQVYPPAREFEHVVADQLVATRQVEELSCGAQITRYFIEHPHQSDTWLVVTDPISGFEDRHSGNETLVSTLDDVLSTLCFYR